MNPDFQRALACATEYRRRGLSPLPSRMDRKGPKLESFAEFYRGEPVPESVYDRWSTSNIQVITGTTHAGRTKLLVVDLDGEDAVPTWKKICARNGHRNDPTWICRTGSGGIHVYFRLADTVSPCPSGMIWGVWDTFGDDGSGGWIKHREIRILADRSLVIAPPSIHVDTGKRYEFLPGCGPNEVPLPSQAPAWLVGMPRLSRPGSAPPRVTRTTRQAMEIRPGSGRLYDRDDVMRSIPDKLAIAQDWGLRVTGQSPNGEGWISCFAVNRDERKPSGSFHSESGVYKDMRDGTSISLFDLGVILRPEFLDWINCLSWCGDRYLAPRAGRTT